MVKVFDLLPAGSPWTIERASAPESLGRINAIAVYGGTRHLVQLTMLPMSAPCCDLDADGIVNQADVAMILAKWGSTGAASEDLNLDGQIGIEDLLIAIDAWAGSEPTEPVDSSLSDSRLVPESQNKASP